MKLKDFLTGLFDIDDNGKVEFEEVLFVVEKLFSIFSRKEDNN
ncbi:MAG: hypothetical protein PWP46_465 [Fusobacteriaceae bacterium]|jgi:hypothetical protein|nr:hypothetical protein [Fusobacteriaceae bacterium]